ncbi:MAG: RDD family protein [Actinomycetota bacterium]|nr:RDD family protein [Actinomycetota bacterium]
MLKFSVMAEARQASLLTRAVARGIDLILVITAAQVLHTAGFLAGVGYILIGDGVAGGASLGKRLMGLAVKGPQGAPCQVRESALRNATISLALLLWKIPFAGWILTLVIFTLEFLVLFGSPEARRIGDEIANTWVVEARFKEAV